MILDIFSGIEPPPQGTPPQEMSWDPQTALFGTPNGSNITHLESQNTPNIMYINISL